MGGRPKNGYTNQAGQSIPGVHDITGRFKDGRGLMEWSFRCGKEAPAEIKSLREYQDENRVLDIGSVVHKMAEMDIDGYWGMDAITHYVESSLPVYEHRMAAVRSYAAFRQWREQFHIGTTLWAEKPLVSEHHQYGGTPDRIVRTENGPAILDFKSCNPPKDGSRPTPWPEQLVVMAAHGRLWLENGGEPLTGGYHLILLPKDGTPFVHYRYTQAQIDAYWLIFEAYRPIYDLDKECSRAAALDGRATVHADIIRAEDRQATHQSILAETHPGLRPYPAQMPPIREKRAAERFSYSPQPPMSMAEILRSYGHVRATA